MCQTLAYLSIDWYAIVALRGAFCATSPPTSTLRHCAEKRARRRRNTRPGANGHNVTRFVFHCARRKLRRKRNRTWNENSLLKTAPRANCLGAVARILDLLAPVSNKWLHPPHPQIEKDLPPKMSIYDFPTFSFSPSLQKRTNVYIQMWNLSRRWSAILFTCALHVTRY